MRRALTQVQNVGVSRSRHVRLLPGLQARVDLNRDIHVPCVRSGGRTHTGVGAVELQCFLMDPCVYTTQYGPWLRASVGCSPKKPPVWFRSGKRWKKAHQLLTSHPTLPVLFREQDGTTLVLACSFVADLVEIHFVADHLATARDVRGLKIACGCSATR